MGFEKFLFYVLAATVIAAAGMVVTRRNPVHAVLFLVVAFVASAMLWMLMDAEFLAISLVLVYVGAVLVLFLFVIMMLDVDIATLKAQFIRHLPLALVVGVIMLIEIFMVVGPGNFGGESFPTPAHHGADYSNTRELGLLLYSVYLYPFEIAAVILLVAIVAAIRLTLRHRPDTKYIDPSRQVSVRKGPDRVQIVRMPPEPRRVPPTTSQTVSAQGEEDAS
ncbi:MAG: NADH-quinone oxidoreductase subunit J [Chromatiaceae bacterium]|nr:NADH-quinone oxidoreductase subunit J [Chromatiaceae bacterium]HSO80155.1 NADH-quinone oxidoreductase subunit J [Chromatiaceae bacterium]